MRLPEPLQRSPWGQRLSVAVMAVRSAGKALMDMRGEAIRAGAQEDGQLKTAIDLAAEGWVVGLLEGSFPGEPILAEERYELSGGDWTGADAYWTVDALDGTRSYMDGFDGFCVQVAYVDDGIPRLGAIAEPVTGVVFAGAAGAGAWQLGEGEPVSLAPALASALRPRLRFVDSTVPRGAVGRLVSDLDGTFVECGSVGLKICRLVAGRADIYAKAFEFKLWDVAPGEALLREVGGKLGSWDGCPISYARSGPVRYRNLLCASASLFAGVANRLLQQSRGLPD